MYRTDAVRIEIDDLLGGVSDPRLLHCFGVVAVMIDDRLEFLRDLAARQRTDARDLRYVCDRHNACDHGNGNTRLADLIEEIVEDVIVEKHLCRGGGLDGRH